MNAPCHNLLTSLRNRNGETVVVKGVRHWRIENERDVLQKFQSQAPIRPLIDEIIDPTDPPGIVLRHLDDDLLSASSTKRLTRPEIKYVAKSVLQTLTTLHTDGYVHTGWGPSLHLNLQQNLIRSQILNPTIYCLTTKRKV